MTDGTARSQPPETGWRTTHVYTMAVVSLLIGLLLGYLFRGSASRPAAGASSQTAAQSPGMGSGMPHMPTLEQMKQMGDVQAEPLLEKLKTDPKNAGLLVQVARIYESVHQFKDAAGYFQKALAADPQNVATSNELASCLYYSGDIDGALAQLQQSLKADPANANALFNLGLIKWNGRKDATGAVAAWQQLLKSNPALDENKKSEVNKLIAEASTAKP